MIVRTAPPWQSALAQAISDPFELLDRLGLTPSAVGIPEDAEAARRQFPLRVPLGFVDRMVPGDPGDPLLRQVLPVGREMQADAEYSPDPLEEADHQPVPGVIHKYRGRALWVITGACAVHCRYCFRRHFPYAETTGRNRWEPALEYFSANESVEEVILSGGDPLSLSDQHLAEAARRLAAIPHLRRLRVHTRLPVVLPERVDEALLAWLTGTRLAPVVVIHANHPNEIDETVRAAIGRMRSAGITVLNQAVLLAGVNDDLATLRRLCELCFEAGALPYYLHRLDPVQGAAHFDVSYDVAERLAGALARTLPGYLVPRVVSEVPGPGAKVPVNLEEAVFYLPKADELAIYDDGAAEEEAKAQAEAEAYAKEHPSYYPLEKG